MHHLKPIRERLGVTQQVLADGIGCTQGNVGHYERGQTLRPEMAARVIAFSASRGLRIGYDHVYGDALLPASCEVAAETTGVAECARKGGMHA